MGLPKTEGSPFAGPYRVVWAFPSDFHARDFSACRLERQFDIDDAAAKVIMPNEPSLRAEGWLLK